jgi:hypothetical protein
MSQNHGHMESSGLDMGPNDDSHPREGGHGLDTGPRRDSFKYAPHFETDLGMGGEGLDLDMGIDLKMDDMNAALETVDCGFSRNLCSTLFFALLFVATLSAFLIAYNTVWANLLFMSGQGPEWTFILFTWLGFSLGGCLAYTFFKTVESLKVRGFFICGLLIPLVIYAQYLNWVQR